MALCRKERLKKATKRSEQKPEDEAFDAAASLLVCDVGTEPTEQSASYDESEK